MIVLLIKLIVILFIRIALFFPLLGMVVGFAIRIPIIWITMVFMPFVALSFVIKGILPGEFDPWQKIGKTFLVSVFLPAMVAVPFVIGFVMIRAGLQSSSSAFPAFAGLDAEFVNAGIPLYAGMGSLWDIFWMLIALAIMWVGVFTVLKQQKIGEAVIEKIKGGGTGLGKTMAQIPLSVPLPLLPGGKGGKAPMELMKDFQGFQRNLSSTGNIFKAAGMQRPPEHAAKTAIEGAAEPVKVNIQAKINSVITAQPGVNRSTAVNDLIRHVRGEFRDNRDMQNMNDDTLMRGIAQSFPQLQTNLEKAIAEQQRQAAAPPPPPATP